MPDRIPATFSAQQVVLESSEFLHSFNYDVEYDPINGVVVINLTQPASHRRIQLPFDRLSFVSFVGKLQAAHESMKARENGGTE